MNFTLGAHESERESHSAVSNSLRPHELQPARLLCPWNSSGKNTGVCSHSLLQGNLLNPETEPRSLALQADSLSSESPGKPLGSIWAQLKEKAIILRTTGTAAYCNRERNRHFIISTEKSASRSMKEGRFYSSCFLFFSFFFSSSCFRVHKFSHRNCMDADRRYKTCGSEEKTVNIMFIAVLLVPQVLGG